MKILFLATLVILVACAPGNGGARYDTTSKDRWPKITIEIHWQDKDKIGDVCELLGSRGGTGGEFNACARSKPDDVNVCEIYAIRPDTFDDTKALEVLGHETWHCFGAKHK